MGSTESHLTGRSAEAVWIAFEGVQYRMRRRGPQRIWYLQFEHRGQRINHSTGTAAREAATEIAKLKIRAVLDGWKDALRNSMRRDSTPAVCRMDAIFDWARLHGGKRALAYVNSMTWVLRKALQVEAGAVGQLSASVLNKATVRSFFEQGQKEASTRPNQQSANGCRTSFNAYMRQACALFAKAHIEDMKDDGLALPELRVFLANARARRFPRVPKEIALPSDRVIGKTLVAWKGLDRNRFLAVGLMLSCGLRKSQAEQARWSWFRRMNGRPMLHGLATTKNRKGRVYVTPLNPFWRVMLRRIEREGWAARCGDGWMPAGGGAEDYVLQCASDTARRVELFNETSAWLRSLGWETPKTNHCLRDYVGSLVTMKYGVTATKNFLDHSSVKVSEECYSSFVERSRLVRPERIFISWA